MLARAFFLDHPVRRQRQLFSTVPRVARTPDTVKELYRAQDQDNFFSLVTFVLGVFASVHYREFDGRDVVQHQKSTRLVGTTACKDTARKLARGWKHNTLLTIDPSLIREYLIDVTKVVRLTGTGFYTKINEFEHSTSALPLCSVKSIEFLDEGKITSNPFYVSPLSSEKLFELIYQEQLKFLQNLFSHGNKMSPEERQKALNAVINLYAELYEQQFGSHQNPYTMRIEELIQFINNPKFNSIFSDLNPDETLLEILTTQGDALFMENQKYKRLLGYEETDKLILASSEYYGRNSYSYD